MQISLKAARINAKMKQTEVADRLGVSRQTVTSWEKGEKVPKPMVVLALASIYNISEDDIFLPTGLTNSKL